MFVCLFSLSSSWECCMISSGVWQTLGRATGKLCHYGITAAFVSQNSINSSSSSCHCLGVKFQAIGGEKLSRYLPIFFYMLCTPWSYSHGDCVILLNCSLIVDKTKTIFPGNTNIIILTTQWCCNEGENTTEESREGATLYFLHKNLLEEEI